MTAIPRSLVLACVMFGSVMLTVVLLAQAPLLDAKLGLWEITTTVEMGGQMPAIDTSKMTPEQKSRMEAAMKGMMGPHSNVRKTCMTKEKLEKSMFTEDRPGTTCKRTATANSRTTLDVAMTCVGTHPMTGQVHIDMLSSTSMKGAVKATGTDQGRTVTMNSEWTSKWVAADCGDVK